MMRTNYLIRTALTAYTCLNRHSVRALSSSSNMPPLLVNDLRSEGMQTHLPLAQRAMDYLDSSPDPFHVVHSSTKLLEDAGFVELKEEEAFSGKVQAGGKYYYTRNRSTLVAFAVGKKWKSGNGFKVIGAHTDSPNLRVKPNSKRSAAGCTQLGVECYGGGLWHTWFDRDLGISGRVLVRTKAETIEQRLVLIKRAVLRIPNLAIHLQTAEERVAFKVNKEDHLSPILATEVKKALQSQSKVAEGGWPENQEPLLLQILANELDVSTDEIVDFELSLFDVQQAALGGVYSEFIHSARLDNLASCFLAVEGIVEHVQSGLIDDDEDISIITLYDHEEVGSTSQNGAGSPVMGEAVKRISAALSGENDTLDADFHASSLRKSFVLSVDQAHAIHPNYASKHEKAHSPKMNDGMVIKRNSNQRYATNTITGVIMKEVARKAGLPPLQEFVVRNDCGCGSTIGPIISANTGIRAIDMGCPQLSMHSIRETMGVADCKSTS